MGKSRLGKDEMISNVGMKRLNKVEYEERNGWGEEKGTWR